MSNYLECNHSKLMIDIEHFVKKTLQERKIWNDFRNELRYLVQEIEDVYTPSLYYSTYIQAFLELMEKCRFGGAVDEQNLDKIAYRTIHAMFSKFERKAQRELNSFVSSEQRNRDRLLNYLENLINHYSKLLFIRVDLAYLKAKHSTIDISVFKDDVQKLIGFIQDGDTCFKDIEGYAWALEQGEDKGYHCHLLLIYNGAVRKQDYYYADQVIARWRTITEEDGYGFNCNTKEHKDQFRRLDKLGVGMIHRDNPREVSNALNTCAYLVNPEKTNQYLRVKSKNMRTFGTGTYHRCYRRYKRIEK